MSTADSTTTYQVFTRTGTAEGNYSRPHTGRSWATKSAGGRLNTAQSRPGTGRPQTAASSRREASYVLAILEGRGMGKEVGIAALDKDTGRVNLIQVRIHLHIHSDNCAYDWAPPW